MAWSAPRAACRQPTSSPPPPPPAGRSSSSATTPATPSWKTWPSIGSGRSLASWAGDESDPQLMKPRPCVVRAAVSIVDAHPAECAFVGDSTSDMLAVRVAGGHRLCEQTRQGRTTETSGRGCRGNWPGRDHHGAPPHTTVGGAGLSRTWSWARRLAQRRAQGSGIAFKDGMWPVGEGNCLVRVDRDVARVPDHYSAILNLYGEPDLFGTAVCINEFHIVATRGKRDTVRALCPYDVLLDDHALKVPLRIEEHSAHEAILHVHGDREATRRGVGE